MTHDHVHRTGQPPRRTRRSSRPTTRRASTSTTSRWATAAARQALANAGAVGAQGLSNFGVGRTNNELGFGGLVLSASSESVSVLLRALSESHRLEVLSRPQIMTLDNQPAFIQVGQRVPRITGTTAQPDRPDQLRSRWRTSGLILGVTPRISPDGLVVMEIDAEKSEVGPEAEGIPISISARARSIRSPRINTTTAQTTVSADERPDGGPRRVDHQDARPSSTARCRCWATSRCWAGCSATTASRTPADRTADHHDAAHRRATRPTPRRSSGPRRRG